MIKLYPFIFVFIFLSSGIAQDGGGSDKNMPDFLSRLNRAKLENIEVRGLKKFYLAGSSIKATLHINAIWESTDNRKSKTVYVEIHKPSKKHH
ncbi:MAG: hypothetical protein ACI9IP_000989 [Arcticibacterium sp.]|jgi:hypothetical protein